MNKALKYGRNHPIVLRSAVVVLSAFGRSEEAIRLGEEAVALDPLLTFSYLNLSYAYASVSRFEDAINSLKRAREISMDRNDNLVILYVLNNQKQEATQENEHLNGPAHDFNEIFIEQKFGDKAKASTLLQQFIKVHGKNSPWKCAQAAAFLGDKDLAFEWLEKCYQERNPPSVRIKVDPLLSSLRGENRFKALIKKMDFPSGD